MLIPYVKAFLVGGALCALGQILIDRTKLTPARILTCYVVLGVVLGALGLYEPLVDWAGAGATVPLTGFGYSLARGVKPGRSADCQPSSRFLPSTMIPSRQAMTLQPFS